MMFDGQPSDSEGPVFREPWEAQAFALVLALHERGQIDWKEWAAALHLAIAEAQLNGDGDSGDTYYQHWLSALESQALSRNFVSNAELILRKEQWRSAYLHTPHGQPVALAEEVHKHS